MHGANPNDVDSAGETPLHVACRHDSVAAVDELVQFGACVDAVDAAGRGAMHHAAFGNGVWVYHLTSLHQSEDCGGWHAGIYAFGQESCGDR
jgi:ankyrin repeat protein